MNPNAGQAVLKETGLCNSRLLYWKRSLCRYMDSCRSIIGTKHGAQAYHNLSPRKEERAYCNFFAGFTQKAFRFVQTFLLSRSDILCSGRGAQTWRRLADVTAMESKALNSQGLSGLCSACSKLSHKPSDTIRLQMKNTQNSQMRQITANLMTQPMWGGFVVKRKETGHCSNYCDASNWNYTSTLYISIVILLYMYKIKQIPHC